MRKLVFVVANLVAFAACSSPGNTASSVPQPVAETGKVFSRLTLQDVQDADNANPAHRSSISAPEREVWRVLQSAFDSLGIPVNSVDTSTHTIVNTGFDVRQKMAGTIVTKLFDCGEHRGGSSSLSYDLFVGVSTKVVPVSSTATDLLTTVAVRGKPVTYSGSWVRCDSMGALEQKIHDVVAAKLFH